MKILGFHSGHDSSYGILENGIPILHNEIERFNRKKNAKEDSLMYYLNDGNDRDVKYKTRFTDFIGFTTLPSHRSKQARIFPTIQNVFYLGLTTGGVPSETSLDINTVPSYLSFHVQNLRKSHGHC